jgi:hypothetical protein
MCRTRRISNQSGYLHILEYLVLWETTPTYLGAMNKPHLAAGVLWKQWQDGIAVYVASTCETHVLASELLPVFMDSMTTSHQCCQAGQSDNASSEDNDPISQEILNLLASLKIIDLVD